MKDGDCAGFSAFNSDSGTLTIKKVGKKCVLEMSEQSVSLTDREKAVEKVEEKVVESIDLKGKTVYLRIDGDFRAGERGGRDLATFFYSLDGEQWTKIGSDYRMRFDWRRFFMGSKFAIFNYATKRAGGYINVDRFDYQVAPK